MALSAVTVRISGGSSAKSIQNYNKQEKKLGENLWNGISYDSNDLVEYLGEESRSYLNDSKKSEQAFLDEVSENYKAHDLLTSAKNGNKNIEPKKVLTIIQSFSPDANDKNLTPLEAHEIGKEYYEQINKYTKEKLGFSLPTALISTHTDDNQTTQRIDEDNRQNVDTNFKHLHNHIVLPNYSSNGINIREALGNKKVQNDLKKINDNIILDHGLNDYLIGKMADEALDPKNMMQPRHSRHKSSLNNGSDFDSQKNTDFEPINEYQGAEMIAIQRLQEANMSISSDELNLSKMKEKDFLKLRAERNDYLDKEYSMKTKVEPAYIDIKDRFHPQTAMVTFDDFKREDGSQVWIKVDNLGNNIWKDQASAQSNNLVIFNESTFKKMYSQRTNLHQMQDALQYKENHPEADLEDVFKSKIRDEQDKGDLRLSRQTIKDRLKNITEKSRDKFDELYNKGINYFDNLKSKVGNIYNKFVNIDNDDEYNKEFNHQKVSKEINETNKQNPYKLDNSIDSDIDSYNDFLDEFRPDPDQIDDITKKMQQEAIKEHPEEFKSKKDINETRYEESLFSTEPNPMYDEIINQSYDINPPTNRAVSYKNKRENQRHVDHPQNEQKTNIQHKQNEYNRNNRQDRNDDLSIDR